MQGAEEEEFALRSGTPNDFRYRPSNATFRIVLLPIGFCAADAQSTARVHTGKVSTRIQ